MTRSDAKATHTPGPWHPQMWMEDWPTADVRAPHGVTIATVYNVREEGVANQSLITAAPELLEACKSAQLAMGAHGPCDHNSCAKCSRTWKKLLAVIAKAEGRNAT